MRVVLRYKIVIQNATGCLLEIKLITGKFHQIRAQLSNIGCPIIGDAYYGSTKIYKENAICLHAKQLSFVHPLTNEALHIIAPVPDDEVWNSFVMIAPI